MRLDLHNLRDMVPNDVELVDPVVATKFTVPAHQHPQHCDDVAHMPVEENVEMAHVGTKPPFSAM